jgi:hypothetical protein
VFTSCSVVRLNAVKHLLRPGEIPRSLGMTASVVMLNVVKLLLRPGEIPRSLGMTALRLLC